MTLRVEPISPVRLDKFDQELESEKRRFRRKEVSPKPESSFSVHLSNALKEKEK